MAMRIPAATTISILLSPWGFYSRCSVLIGGQVIEDIDNYNKVHEMFRVFSATDNKDNDYGDGFGNYCQHESTSRGLDTNNKSLTRIPPLSSMTVF